MAIVKTLRGALRADQLPELTDAASGNSTTINIVAENGDVYVFQGQFTFDQFGRPSGTINTISLFDGDRENFTVEGLMQDAAPFFQSPTIGLAVIQVLAGDDVISGRARDDVLLGAGGNDRLLGNAGFDNLFGNDGNDRIYGGGDGDVLYGADGDDRLFGDDGSDSVFGGTGADRLTGGAGSDTFYFTSTADSTRDPLSRDRILDFSSAEGDKIDLTLINAVEGAPGDAAFSIVDAFTRVAGQLTVTAIDGGYLVLGDTDGNGRADFALNVVTAETLTANDFNL